MTEESRIKKRKFVIEDVVVKDPECIEPCLIKFSNGILRNPEEMTGMLFRNSSEKYLRLRKQRIFKVSGPHLSYIGKNYGDESASDSKERLFIGILDKETKKMKLVETSSFLLHPDLNDDHFEETLIPDNSKLSYEDQRKNLSEFGGRRARTNLKKYEENKINFEDMGEVMNAALKKVKTTNITIEELNASSDYEYLLPPCNREAEFVEDVYSLENIITTEELLLFNESAVEHLEASEIPENLSLLFGHTLANAKLLPVSDAKKAKIICANLYMEQLVKLFRSQNFRIKGNDKNYLANCPWPLKEKVSCFFFDGTKKTKSKQMEDRLIAHIIVLALIINQFEMSWKPFSASLGIKKERLENIIKLVGATFYRDTGIIKLKLPLQKFDRIQSKKFKKI